MLLKRFTFIISIVAVVYFAYMILVYVTGTELPVFAGAVHEMVMLPLMFATPVFLVIALIHVIGERFNLRSKSLYSLLLLLMAATMLYLLMRGYIPGQK